MRKGFGCAAAAIFMAWIAIAMVANTPNGVGRIAMADGLDGGTRHKVQLADGNGYCRSLHAPDDYAVSFFIDGAIHGYRNGGFIAMNAALNGVKRHVVLDTGAGVNVISSKDAGQCGLRLTNSGIKVRGVGSLHARMAVADTLRIGRMVWVNVPFYVVDFKTGNQVADKKTEAGMPPVLGLPWMNAVGEVKLDFVNRKLVVPEKLSVMPTTGRNLHFLENGKLMVKVTDADGKPLRMHLDTGAYETVLDASWYEKNKIRVESEGTPDSIRYAGIGGVVMQHSYRMPDMALAIGGVLARFDKISVATGIDLHTGVKVVRTEDERNGMDGVVGLNMLECYGMVTISMHGMFIEAKGTSQAYRRKWWLD